MDTRSSTQPPTGNPGPRPTSSGLRSGSAQLRRLAMLCGCALILLCALTLALTVALPSTAQGTDDVWAAGAMQTPRNSHAAILLPDGRVLAVGGWDGIRTLASAELYDPRTQAWTPTGAMSSTRAYPTATLLPNGQVLVTGGWDNAGAALASVELYDPAADRWSAAAPMSLARAGHTATLLPTGKVLVVGGADDAAAAGAELYDPATNTWITTTGGMGAVRGWHTATLLPGGKVLVAGGWDRERQPLASAELYDPATNTWTVAGRMTAARVAHAATLLPDGRVLVTGGYDGSFLASAELYDPAANGWTATAAMSTPRVYHTATLLRNGKVLVAGGASGNSPSDRAETYHPQAGNWTPAGGMHAAYESHGAILLSNDKVLITGKPGNDHPTAAGPQPPAGGGQNSRLPTPTSQPPMQPTPTPKAANAAGQAEGQAVRNVLDSSVQATTDAVNVEGVGVAAIQASVTASNFATGTTAARLYGVYEASFTLPQNGDRYAMTHYVTFTAQLAPISASNPIAVMAFYDGTNAGRDLWRARVYVNRIGDWNVAFPPGATGLDNQSPPITAFTAIEEATAGLRGMLRVSSETTTVASLPIPIDTIASEMTMTQLGVPKRWYTDDGRAFLPRADTAYRLFFEMPITSTPAVPNPCPTTTLTIANADAFVWNYVNDVMTRGVNVLRVESLGTWAYTDEEIATQKCGTTSNPRACTRQDDCNADLSLFWSNTAFSMTGTTHDLFGGGPNITITQGTTTTLYPNLQSFQRTDRKLQLLLTQFPTVYLQLLLVPEPPFLHNTSWPEAGAASIEASAFPDNVWLGTAGIKPEFRQQLWQTMIARWAAFPNVFWSISNDLGDTATIADDPFYDPTKPGGPYVNNIALADEVGCYIADCPGTPGKDPWRANRPLSFGHLRYRTDSSMAKPWHTYITAYTGSDLSAQQMDGTRKFDVLWPFTYTLKPKPTFNVEDWYEGTWIQNPNYYYRRLFWSYLLSGGGATYGNDEMYQAWQRYSTANLHGLDSITYTQKILDAARIDLALFKPNDKLITVTTQSPPVGVTSQDWADFNRAQVTYRSPHEILAYIPNTASSSVPALNPDGILSAAAATTPAAVTVNMTDFTDEFYAVTWYRADTGAKYPYTITIEGNKSKPPLSYLTRDLEAPNGWEGDVVLHISSLCQSPPNRCLGMDTTELPPGAYLTKTNGTQVILGTVTTPSGTLSATLNTDQNQRVLGNASWRCDRPPAAPQWEDRISCLLQSEFPVSSKDTATVEFYFRRNSKSAIQYFRIAGASSSTADLSDWSKLHEIGLWFGEDDIVSFVSKNGVLQQIRYRRNVPLESNRWYHAQLRVTNKPVNSGYYTAELFLDGALVYTESVWFGEPIFLRGIELYTSWWGAIDELDTTTTPSVWWDGLAMDPPVGQGLYRAFFQQAAGMDADTQATWFDASGGYNTSTYLLVGENTLAKTLLKFNVSAIPANAIVDEATLQVYYAGRSNGNSLTLGAHRVLADWTDSQANWSQRKTGVNWGAAGMGGGSDYAATPEATAAVVGTGGEWVDLNVTSMAQAWIANAANNQGVVLRQNTASGYVIYNFCSEFVDYNSGAICIAGKAPKLILRYHLMPPAPVKATFQRGVNGYTGNQAAWFDAVGGNNNTAELLVGQNGIAKSLLKFDVATIPITATVDEATLQLYYTSRSNGNTLRLGAQRVLVDWVDSQANWTQRQSGVNWGVAGMGSGNDYAALADGTADVGGPEGPWVNLNVTAMMQAWVANPTSNKGMVVLQNAASGYVTYKFCSELGWSPCNAALAPKLTIWYH